MKRDHLIGIVFGAAIVAGIGGGIISTLSRAPERNLLSQLREQESDIGVRWQGAVASAIAYHPAKPIRFPPVEIASPILWDWYEHAIMLRETRQWTWPILYVSTAVSYGSSSSLVVSTCWSTPQASSWPITVIRQ